jgi:fatty acid desaturase
MLMELGVNALLAAVGLLVFLLDERWPLRICGLVLWTAGSLGIGTNTHTSSHEATSDKRWVNQLLTYLGYPLYFGLPATYWWHKHVLTHHSAPNVIGVDGDADLSPWFATTVDEVERASGFRRVYYERLQQYVFPLAISLTLISQQVAGIVYVIRSLRRDSRTIHHVLDIGCLVAHVIAVVVVPILFFRPVSVIAFYVARSVVISYAMFSVFAPAHFSTAAARLDKGLKRVDYALAVTMTTLNFRMGRLGKLICSGLEYQIEHHLLPDISYVHYPAISRYVEEYCKENGLPYRQYRWELALWRSLSAIRHPCAIVRDPDALLLRNDLLVTLDAGRDVGAE